MSTRIIYKNAVVSEDELAFEYYRLSAYREGGHAARWTPSRFDSMYLDYVANGRKVPDGEGRWRADGTHTDGKYAQFSYGVVELGWV